MKIFLWIGSGLSVAAGYPSAAQLLEEMAREADDPLDTSRPFFAVADAFVESVGKAQLAELLQRLYRAPRAFTPAHRALARLAGRGRFHAIITTSFDDLLERALDDERVPYVVRRPEDEAPRSAEGDVQVLKVEGSFDDWMRIMVSGQAYEIAGRRYPFLENQIDALLRERPVLFVGGSLQDRRLLGWISALPEDRAAALKPWRAVIPRVAWDAALAYRYEDGGAERAAGDVIRRVPIRPLLLESPAELPRLLADVAALLAPAKATPQMRLRKIFLRDFRGFRDITIALPDEPLAVLVGVNGAGKSSALEAIALLFGWFAQSISVTGDPRLSFISTLAFESNVRQGIWSSSVGADVELDGETRHWALTIELPKRMTRTSTRTHSADGVSISIDGIDDGGLRARLAVDENASIPVLCF